MRRSWAQEDAGRFSAPSRFLKNPFSVAQAFTAGVAISQNQSSPLQQAFWSAVATLGAKDHRKPHEWPETKHAYYFNPGVNAWPRENTGRVRRASSTVPQTLRNTAHFFSTLPDRC